MTEKKKEGKEGLDCPHGATYRYANPVLEAVARKAQPPGEQP
ncbi:MAG: hypothetical protein WC530_11035 [Candidatus Omnitrophota bacterium]